MISDLDQTLQRLLTGEAAAGSELATATILFAAPDKDWRAKASGLVLNIYLCRITENRDLRSGERRATRGADGLVTVEPPPARIDCHYLLTAWNMAAPTPGAEREPQEHRLLSQALYVLLRNPSVPRVYLNGLLAPQEIEPPLLSAQVEDSTANSPDFWSALGTYVRPAIVCRATLALDLRRDVTGPMVTSIVARTGEGDELVTIGGLVRSSGPPPHGVANAWVRVDETGRVCTTDAEGAFRVEGLRPGSYTLSVRATGFHEAVRSVIVPAPDGIYNVTISPL